MQIILLEKVINVGNLGDVVKVKDGYARNFLIPQKLARRATAAAVAEFEAKRAALQKVVEDGKQNELETMCRDWPFFSTRLGMLEMVFSKADLWLAEYYDQRLVKPELWALGKELRELLEGDIKVVLDIANDSHLMADLPWIAESIQLRNIYTDPLNVLQAELLHRSRLAEEEGKEPDPRVEQALMVTIAGVAAGMRNTG